MQQVQMFDITCFC